MSKNIDPQDVQSFLKKEFSKVAEVAVRATSASVTITYRGTEYKYKLPKLSENQHFLPGWFTAGIWDDLGLPSSDELPDGQVFNGWSFTKAEGTNYQKKLSADKILIYNSSNNHLFVQNVISKSLTIIGDWPTKSIFHAQQLFEENGFFPESEDGPIPPLKISAYRIQ
jgi:hypothetical protein